MAYRKNWLGTLVYVGDYPDEVGDLWVNNRSKTMWQVWYATDTIDDYEHGDCKLYRLKRIGKSVFRYVPEEILLERYTKGVPVLEVTLKVVEDE